MTDLLAIILPVFLVIGMGYLAVWRGLMDHAGVDALMKFAQGIAIPLLLFRAMSTLDLSAGFDLALLGSFYTGALTGFAAGLLIARYGFHRPWEDSVAIGFCCLFSNALLLGLAVTERAYGADALTANYAIIAIHSPICYAVGITAMELARARGAPLHHLPGKVARAMLKNALIVGIVAGMLLNVAGLTLPRVLTEGVDLLTRAALPAALFGLGGVLVRYRPEGDLRLILIVCGISVIWHPMVTLGLGRMSGLDPVSLRSAVITGAMPTGINAYIFANMYGVAKRVAASSVLLATVFSIITTIVWLTVLG